MFVFIFRQVWTTKLVIFSKRGCLKTCKSKADHRGPGHPSVDWCQPRQTETNPTADWGETRRKIGVEILSMLAKLVQDRPNRADSGKSGQKTTIKFYDKNKAVWQCWKQYTQKHLSCRNTENIAHYGSEGSNKMLWKFPQQEISNMKAIKCFLPCFQKWRTSIPFFEAGRISASVTSVPCSS